MAGVFAPAAGGLALGGVAALFGLKLTRFDIGPDGSFYTPNTYIGASLTALLVGRLVYRFMIVMPTLQVAAQGAPGGDPFATYQRSPLTLAMLMLTVGYYLAYFAGVLLEARRSRLPAP